MRQRAYSGWAGGDTFDMVSYHAGVTLGMLQHFKINHMGHPDGMTQEEYDAKLDIAIDAWTAKYDLMTDRGWDPDKQSLDEWSTPLKERWERGYPVFIDIYDSLWI